MGREEKRVKRLEDLLWNRKAVRPKPRKAKVKGVQLPPSGTWRLM